MSRKSRRLKRGIFIIHPSKSVAELETLKSGLLLNPDVTIEQKINLIGVSNTRLQRTIRRINHTLKA